MVSLSRNTLIAVSLTVLALILAIVSTAINYWYMLTKTIPVSTGVSGEITFYAGIWEVCMKSSNIPGTPEHKCWTVSQLEDIYTQADVDVEWMKGCEATMILGVLTLAVAAALPFVQAIPKRVAAVVNVVGGIFCIIAAIIYAAKHKDPLPDELRDGNLHAGFALAIVGGVVAFAAGGVLALMKAEN